jgi:sigma-54 dependent transcriptional regulator, acetoin dehydrogenase operon transcriptional activator AcoR
MLARLALAAPAGVIDEAVVEATCEVPSAAPPASLQTLHRSHILAAHAEAGGDVSEAARRLGISRNTVYRALHSNEGH